ncbi:hypothetical protein BTO06_09810 [Tenacibaculum sp. SZ-18]|uniref:hypothetical protein n=1 Tax=Tenacibaculum sp. SZ-18 TaxID=754423 RepID=UPI000C2D277B|nr:hypothetical protein [Tenacibaculum sp. SZ-18]AUC15415.1 hypothetical protein BTO06_09810 [Tenacibaculum sp. SZ-18]
MIVLKINPVGIDREIQNLQKYLESKLSTWNLEIYGRVETIENKLHIHFKRDDYKEVLVLNNSFSGRVFFIDSNSYTVSRNRVKTKLEIVFLLDLSKIKTGISHRCDEEVRVELIELISKKIGDDINVSKGQEVLKNYQTELTDMQPYHFIGISFDYTYSQNNCFK